MAANGKGTLGAMKVIICAVQSESLLEELKWERRITESNRPETEEFEFVLLGLLVESAAVFRVWSKAPSSDAKEKPCCRSDNTSLPQQVHHQGHQIIHVAIHQAGCWLIGGHNTVAQEFNKCVTRKKLRGPVIKQCMADLPAVRTEVAPLFTNVGFNIFGPCMIHSQKTRGGAANSKLWGLVITCLRSP